MFHIHRHTHWNSVVVAVCVAMAACCCSDVVERRSSLTRHQMCLFCDRLAGVTWELSSQSGRKSTFCELKACQHCEQRRRGKRDAVMERAWWGFLVPFLDKNSRLLKTKKVQLRVRDSLCSSVPQSLIQNTDIWLQSCRKTWKPIL